VTGSGCGLAVGTRSVGVFLSLRVFCAAALYNSTFTYVFTHFLARLSRGCACFGVLNDSGLLIASCVCVLPLEWSFVFFTFYASALGGIKRYRYPSVCLSHGAAALGA